jgi:hypothetical protein
MRRLLIALVAVLMCCGDVYPDGYRPAKPYRYLHPPPALRRGNYRPSSGSKILKLTHGYTLQFIQFTGDRQAGLGTSSRAFSLGRPATRARVQITPVISRASVRHRIGPSARVSSSAT